MGEPLKPYLELSNNPVRFEAVNQVTNVFFDDSNKQIAKEKEVFLTNLHSSIYHSAKHTNTRIPLLSKESDIFITANGSDECELEMPNKKKISSKYFTADETNNNQDIVEIYSKKKKSNFDTYIEEIVKQKRRSIQSLDDSLICKTPIDIFNIELFRKTDENSNNIKLNRVNRSIENEIEVLTQFKSCPPKAAAISPNKIKGYHIKRLISNISLRICDNNMLREDNSIDFGSSYCKNNNIINVSKMKIDTQVLQSKLKYVKSSRKVLPSSKLRSNGIEDEDVIFVDNLPPKAQSLNKELIFNGNVKRGSPKRITTCSNFSETIIIDDSAEELCKNMSFTKGSKKIQSQILVSGTDSLSSGWLNKYSQTMFTCVICKSKFVGRKAYKSHLHVHKLKYN